MATAIITGSAGLVGAESVRFFAKKGLDVVGVDNNMRKVFFGDDGDTSWSRRRLEAEVDGYVHVDSDIRDREAMERLFRGRGDDVAVVIHTAAQPSHDWAARDPHTDFTVNANGTLTLLEACRRSAPHAVFIFTSTNKVYGDAPNRLPLVEQETRWEVDPSHPFAEHGIDESMSIDASKHSLFGASKVAADVLVQEYGRYFGMRTACFRGGCLTGPGHSAAELHGFLAYLAKCAVTGRKYTVFGYKGKQVRDNIHSADLVSAFWHFYRKPRVGEVYNIGGGRHSNCSMLEAIAMCEELTGRKMDWAYSDQNRSGDHVWWISDVRRFQGHYPGWGYRYGIGDIMRGIVEGAAATGKLAGRQSLGEPSGPAKRAPALDEAAAPSMMASGTRRCSLIGMGRPTATQELPPAGGWRTYLNLQAVRTRPWRTSLRGAMAGAPGSRLPGTSTPSATMPESSPDSSACSRMRAGPRRGPSTPS